jgi:transcription termination/antitermination protein NusG
VSDSERRDIDLATAAEQSSEDDEAQTGDVNEWDERSSEPAEHRALHIEDEDEAGEDDTRDLDGLLDALDAAADPEADKVVDDALDVDSADENDASVAASDDEESEDDEDDADDVTPYEGSDDQEHDREAGLSFGDDAAPDAEPDAADLAAAELEAAVETDGDLEDAEAEAEVDPYEEFRLDLRIRPGKWYVIHSYAGFEKRVKQNIESRRQSMGMEDFVYEVQVPMEDVVEIKNGQRKLVTRVRIPGYVLVRMELNEDSWSVVRHTPGVTGFVGNAHNPTPLRFEEAFNMLKSLVQPVEVAPSKAGGAKSSGGGAAAARVIPAEVDFEIGETITIKEGSFAGLPGTINEIKPESGKLTVLVSLFERETPVELSFDQVTKL